MTKLDLTKLIFSSHIVTYQRALRLFCVCLCFDSCWLIYCSQNSNNCGINLSHIWGESSIIVALRCSSSCGLTVLIHDSFIIRLLNDECHCLVRVRNTSLQNFTTVQKVSNVNYYSHIVINEYGICFKPWKRLSESVILISLSFDLLWKGG